MWSLKCPSGIPIDALCRDLSFCWLLNYFLKFPQLFIVLFDLQKGYWSRSFFFPSDQMRRVKFMDIFQERNDLLIRVNYVKERAKIEFGFCSPYLILLISVFATSSVLSSAVRISRVLELMAWPTEYSHNTGEILSLGFM